MKEIARRLVGNVWRTGVVEENGNGGSQPVHGAVLAEAFAYASGTAINTWNNDPALADTDGFVHDVGGGLSDGFEIPVGLGGLYLVTLVLDWTWSATQPTYIKAIIEQDSAGPTTLNNPFTTSSPASATYGADGYGISISCLLPLEAGQVVRAIPEWNGGSSVDTGSADNQQFALSYFGALA